MYDSSELGGLGEAAADPCQQQKDRVELLESQLELEKKAAEKTAEDLGRARRELAECENKTFLT